jgi:hypothetical protein
MLLLPRQTPRGFLLFVGIEVQPEESRSQNSQKRSCLSGSPPREKTPPRKPQRMLGLKLTKPLSWNARRLQRRNDERKGQTAG